MFMLFHIFIVYFCYFLSQSLYQNSFLVGKQVHYLWEKLFIVVEITNVGQW